MEMDASLQPSGRHLRQQRRAETRLFLFRGRAGPLLGCQTAQERRSAPDRGQRREAAGAGRTLNLPDASLTWRELGPELGGSSPDGRPALRSLR
jgi:hypothetical protein